jgi:hypothetical protein
MMKRERKVKNVAPWGVRAAVEFVRRANVPQVTFADTSVMNRPSSSSRLLLVADRRPATPELGAAVRRFRLARLQLEGRSPAPPAARRAKTH